MAPSTALYSFPSRTRLGRFDLQRRWKKVITCDSTSHFSTNDDTTTLRATTNNNVALALAGISMRSRTSATPCGGNSRTKVLNAASAMIENIRKPKPSCVRRKGIQRRTTGIPFVQISLRYGGPMLNTAATRMYWKDETRNKTVFS